VNSSITPLAEFKLGRVSSPTAHLEMEGNFMLLQNKQEKQDHEASTSHHSSNMDTVTANQLSN